MKLKITWVYISHLHTQPSSPVTPSYLALPQVDGEVDELAVLDDQVAQVGGLQELLRLLLQVQGDSCPSLEGGASWVLHDAELRGIRLPDVLLVLIVLRSHHNGVGHCIKGKQFISEQNGQIMRLSSEWSTFKWTNATDISKH